MPIDDIKKKNRYQAYQKWIYFTQEIQEYTEKNVSENNIPIETTSFIKGVIPPWCGNKIDIYC